MANVIIDDTNLTNIANAIRGKNGTQTTYLPSEMATAITNIPSGGGGGIIDDSFFGSDTLVRGVKNTTGATSTTIYGYSSGTQKVETFRSKIGRTNTVYIASTSITSSDIGESILSGNRLVSYTPPSTDPILGNYHTGGPYLSIKDGKILGTYFTFKYNSVSYTENDSSLTNTKVVTIDYNGKITGVFNTWNDLVTALSNKSIDMSKGIGIVGTTITNTEQSTTAPTNSNSVVYSA